MSKKTDDFITGLQIAGGVILAGAAVRHASHLIDGRLEEARYNYGNYPGPPHDRERIGDYLLSLQKQAQKDFDACAALLDARGSLPTSVFEPAPAVDFTDWMVSAWENKTDFFISAFGFYDDDGRFRAAFYLRDLEGRWQLLTGVLESGWGEILLTHLVKGRPLAQIAHCLWVLTAVFGEPRYMVLARYGSLFYSKYRIAYMDAAPDRLLLEPVDLDDVFWRCLRCYGVLESTAASDDRKRPFRAETLGEPRDWAAFLLTEGLYDGDVWIDFRVEGDTATAAFYVRDGVRRWHRVTGVVTQNWAEVLLDAAFYDLPTAVFAVWGQALTAHYGTPALPTSWVMGRLMTLVTPYVVPKRLVEASAREAGEMLGLSGDALAAFENAKAKPATEIPSAAPRFASRTEQVKAGVPVWSDPKKYASAETEEEDLFGEPEKSAVTASEIQAAFAELPQVVASIPRTVPFKEVYDDWSPSREDFSTAVLCARSPSRVLIAVTGYFRDEAHFVCRFWCGEKGDDYWRELDDLVEKGWAEVVLWYLFVKKDTAGLVKRLLKADGMVCRETLDTGRLKARAPFVVEQGDGPVPWPGVPVVVREAVAQRREALLHWAADKMLPEDALLRGDKAFYRFCRDAVNDPDVRFFVTAKKGELRCWGETGRGEMWALTDAEALGWSEVLLWAAHEGQAGRDVVSWAMTYRAAREEYGKAPLTPYRAGDAGIITEKDRQALEAVPPPVKATFDDDFDEDDDEPPVISRWELEDIANAVKPLAEKLTLAAPFAEQYENSWLDSVTLSDACRTLPKTGQVLWVTGRKKRTRLYACRFWAKNRRGQWAEVIDVADNGWSEIFIGAAYGVVKLSDLVRWVKKGGDETPDIRSDERRGTLRTVFAQGTDDPEVLETLPRTSLRAAYQAWEKLKDKVPRPGRRTVRPTEDFYDFIRQTTDGMLVTFGAEKTGDGGPSGITFWGCREGEVPVELLKVEAYGWAPVLLWVILKEKPDDVAAWVRNFLLFNPQVTKPVLAAPEVCKKRTAKTTENA